MKTIQVSYASVHGTLHCVFFMAWMKSAFDYPSELNGQELSAWRATQPVFGSIARSWNSEVAS